MKNKLRTRNFNDVNLQFLEGCKAFEIAEVNFEIGFSVHPTAK